MLFGQGSKEKAGTARKTGVTIGDKCVATNYEEAQPLAASVITIDDNLQNEPVIENETKNIPIKNSSTENETSTGNISTAIIAAITLTPSPVKTDNVDVDLSSQNHPS